MTDEEMVHCRYEIRARGTVNKLRRAKTMEHTERPSRTRARYEVVKRNCKASFKYKIDRLELSFNARSLLYHAPAAPENTRGAVTDRMHGDRERITTFKSSVLRSRWLPCKTGSRFLTEEYVSPSRRESGHHCNFKRRPVRSRCERPERTDI